MSDDPQVVEAGLKVVSKAKPLIYAGNANNCAALAKTRTAVRVPGRALLR